MPGVAQVVNLRLHLNKLRYKKFDARPESCCIDVAVKQVADLRSQLNKLRYKGGTKKIIDDVALQFYYRLNAGKEVIQIFMSSNHSEVAET